MLGIIVLTHDPIASALVSATEHVMGPQDYLIPVDFNAEHCRESCRPELQAAIERCTECDGVILLTDMLGGSPANLCVSVMEKHRVEVISGVNLPMLLKLISIRRSANIDEALLHAQEAGRKYINIASQILPPRNGTEP